jgi:hypothetical protein
MKLIHYTFLKLNKEEFFTIGGAEMMSDATIIPTVAIAEFQMIFGKRIF